MSQSNDADAARHIDEILSAVAADKRAALQALRETIAAAAPDAVEGLSYGIPAFRYRGRPLVSYNASSAHCAFYVMSPAVLERHHDELAEFDLSKGTVRFTPDRPISDSLVTTIVRERVAETDAAADKQRR